MQNYPKINYKNSQKIKITAQHVKIQKIFGQNRKTPLHFTSTFNTKPPDPTPSAWGRGV
jgi:hypothetical protein